MQHIYITFTFLFIFTFREFGTLTLWSKVTCNNKYRQKVSSIVIAHNCYVNLLLVNIKIIDRLLVLYILFQLLITY